LVRLDLEVFALLEAVEICITKLQIHENWFTLGYKPRKNLSLPWPTIHPHK
jgi:hypothetical protein